MSMESCGDFSALPESCIANVLSFTSPTDACRLSVVARTWRSASQSDTVWKRFLPSDYRDILSRAVDGSDSLLDRFHSKKDLYLHLCDHPVLIDGGRKTFSLHKFSGKKSYMLGAKELCIVWVDTPQYWQWISRPDSRFSEVAKLRLVWWLEIRGRINVNMLSSDNKYAAYLVFRTTAGAYGFRRLASGCVTVGGNEGEKRSICLDPEGAEEALDQNTVRPRRRDDGWMEVELGECVVGGDENGDMQMSFMDVDTRYTKRGLVIEGIEIRPKRG